MSDELTQPLETEPAPDPEPEGVVEREGKKWAPVEALIAERERAARKTEEKLRAEYEPLRAKASQADQLAADMARLQPHIEYLQKHPEVMQQAAQPDVPEVSNDEAEKYARRYELYTPTGLDLTRAKQIIADNRAETRQIAKEAAQQAVAPYAQTTASAQARQNFVWAASQVGPDGAPLVDPQELAQMWADFPAELAANPQVARVILDAAVGASVRTGKRAVRSSHEPVYTEAPGGQRGGGYQITDVERRLARTAGVKEKDWADSAKTYRPDATNILGD